LILKIFNCKPDCPPRLEILGVFPALAIFDFDHTITSWDTAARFFVWLIRRSAWKLGIALVALPILGPMFAFRSTRKVPIRFGAWVATLGVSHEQLSVLARAHMREVVERGERFVRSDALARINHHLAQEHVVVVATGCLEILAREIILAEGLSRLSSLVLPSGPTWAVWWFLTIVLESTRYRCWLHAALR